MCVTHGKEFAVCLLGFAVCNRHTANPPSPVVKAKRTYNAQENSIHVACACSLVRENIKHPMQELD